MGGFFMQTEVTGRIDRKYMAHYINSKFNSETSEYYRIGKDLEEFSIDLSPDTESKKNIIGETTFVHNGYEATSTADSYYADTTDPIFETLQDIVDNRHKDDHCKTNVLEVHFWEKTADGKYVAWKQDCYVIPTSYGGDTSGYQIPFTVNYVGDRAKGVFDTQTNTFTPDDSGLTE